MLSEIQNSKNRIVGTKQVLKMLKNKQVKKVFVAEDIDPWLKSKILVAAESAGVECERNIQAKQLGIACGIDVKCSAAAILL